MAVRGPRRKKQGTVMPSASLVASSARYSGAMERIYRPSQGWQEECYRHFEICGEARFAARFFGHAMARARLVMQAKTPDGWQTINEGPSVDDLFALFNGQEGQAQMLEAIGVHLTIAGECFLVGRTPQDADGADLDEIWEICSIKEVEVTGRNWSIKYGPNVTPIKLSDGDTVIRIWLPHPANRIEADSPFRSLLPILGEIEWLTKHIFAQVTSRLAGAGILFLPQGMTFPPPPAIEGKEQVMADNDAVRFMATLGRHMLAPINDPSKPEALVPIVVIAPDDAIDKVKLQTFWSELDQHALELRSEAIRRFAVGMDLPVEQVLGMSSNSGTGGGSSNGVSHWGAWQIEEATIKMFIEPMLELVVQALTVSYTRPLQPNTTDKVYYDTSALRLRPDRAKEARELNAAGKMSDQRMLEENGFSVDDLPDDKEFKRWLLTKIAQGSPTPEMVALAAKFLGLDLTPALDAAKAPAGGEQPLDKGPAPLPDPPRISDNPRPRTPEENPQAAALLSAAEALTLQALMRAGNRMRSGKGASTVGDCSAYAVHTMVQMNGKSDYVLEDAFPTAEFVLEGIADHEQVVPVLHSYCKALFASQAPHTRDALKKYLDAGVTL